MPVPVFCATSDARALEARNRDSQQHAPDHLFVRPPPDDVFLRLHRARLELVSPDHSPSCDGFPPRKGTTQARTRQGTLRSRFVTGPLTLGPVRAHKHEPGRGPGTAGR